MTTYNWLKHYLLKCHIQRAAASFQPITSAMARHRPLMATCVNMGMRLDDKANVSVLIGPASLGFPNTSSWRVALKATDNGRYDEHSSQGQISLSAFQNDQS